MTRVRASDDSFRKKLISIDLDVDLVLDTRSVIDFMYGIIHTSL